MAELTDSLNELLQGREAQISRRIGADEDQTRAAIRTAVPALLAALSQQARPGTGLQQAIERDHDGSILDQLDAYLGGSAQLSPRTTNGAGILEHTLGARQQDLERRLSGKSGLDAGSIAKLLITLAPLLMGMLGKKGRSSGGGGIDIDDLGGLLNREKEDARSTNPDIGDILDSFTGGGSAGTSGSGTSSGGGVGGVLDSILGRKREG
ncbi:MAG: DUF937 domain-containing protein [Chloroflexi bacterium]|nr:DUF937 domain-containing protein [Chloroflexota bacterium]